MLSSCTICCLSETLRVGVARAGESLASFLNTAARVSSDFAVGSRLLVFAAAVYWGKSVSVARGCGIAELQLRSHASSVHLRISGRETWEAYKSAGICSVNAKKRNGRLCVGAARGCGRCVASGCSDAGSNWGARRTSTEGGGESPGGEHGGRRGDGWGLVRRRGGSGKLEVEVESS